VQELGGSTARQLAQAGQWEYSIPWMSCSVYEWGLARRQESSLFHELELFHEFGLLHSEFKHAHQFGLFPEFGEFCEIREIIEICELQETCRFYNCCSETGYAIGCWAVRKTVWCIACFAYSVILVVMVVFFLLSY